MQYRKFSTVLLEAVVIGVLVIVVYFLTSLLGIQNIYIKLFLVGALSHILFEYTGMNEKWCKDTYATLK